MNHANADLRLPRALKVEQVMPKHPSTMTRHDMKAGTPSHSYSASVWTWLQMAARRHQGDGLLAKAASAGLLMVLLGVSGFAMWSSVSTSRSTERAIASSTLSDHYAAAATAVAAEESLERKYRLEPGPDVRRRFEQASARLLQAMLLVRRDGNAQDRVIADRVETAAAASILTEYRCDIAQGYRLCRPVLPEALMRWYNQRPVHLGVPGALPPAKKSQPSGVAVLGGA